MRDRDKSINELPRIAATYETAPLYWVTAPMARVALDASQDVPEVSMDRDAPSPAGLLALAEPLPPLPTEMAIDPHKVKDMRFELPVSALMWRVEEGKLAISALCWKGHVPRDFQPLTPGPLPPSLVEIITIRIPRHQTMALDDKTFEGRAETHNLLSFLSTAWVLMMTPTLAQRKTIDPKTGGAPWPGSEDSIPLVTTIDLRPLHRTDTSEADPEAKSTLMHRFAVRGHWRNQAYGPGYSEHRMTWIPAYIKGFDGAPLLASDKVMVWRR